MAGWQPFHPTSPSFRLLFPAPDFGAGRTQCVMRVKMREAIASKTFNKPAPSGEK